MKAGSLMCQPSERCCVGAEELKGAGRSTKPSEPSSGRKRGRKEDGREGGREEAFKDGEKCKSLKGRAGENDSSHPPASEPPSPRERFPQVTLDVQVTGGRSHGKWLDWV